MAFKIAVIFLAFFVASICNATPLQSSKYAFFPENSRLDAAARFLGRGAYLRLLKRWCEIQPPLICNLVPTTGNTVKGTVLFTPVWTARRCRVLIKAKVEGLTKNAEHGIHSHTYGDLSTSDGKSLGGHFANPAGYPTRHGYPDSPERHWGDFGNLKTNSEGVAVYERIDKMIRIPGMVGRGMIVHAGRDKGPIAQPSGDAGARVAMCVIGYANPDL